MGYYIIYYFLRERSYDDKYFLYRMHHDMSEFNINNKSTSSYYYRFHSKMKSTFPNFPKKNFQV
eukprot:c26797_g2_i1 orf=39-230(+)